MEKKEYLLLIIVAVAALASYLNSLEISFIWDDEGLVLFNYYLENPFSLKEYLSSNAMPQRPVTVLTLLFDKKLYGVSSGGYHFTQILLHSIISVLVSIVGFKLYPSFFFSFVSGLFFAIHPVHTEAVDMLLGRSDLVFTAFLLISFLFYRRYLEADTERKQSNSLTASLFFFVLAVFSKETAVIFPLILYVYYRVSRHDERKYIKSKSQIFPFLIAAFCYVLFWAALSFGSIGGFYSGKTPFEIKPYGGGFISNYILQFETLGRYIELLLFPFNLKIWYEPHTSINIPNITASIILIFIFFFIPVYYGKRILKFFSLWILIGAIPLLNIVPIPGSMAAERWIYFASIGYCFLFSYVLTSCLNKDNSAGYGEGNERNFELTTKHRVKLIEKFRRLIFIVLISLIFLILTVSRNKVYSNEVSFYSDILKKEPDSSIIAINYAMALSKEGNPEKAIEVLNDYLKSNKKKYLDQAYNYLGVAYDKIGRKDIALKCFKEAAKVNPNSVFALINLGSAYTNSGDLVKARRYLDAALVLEQFNPDVNYNYGIILDSILDYRGAIEKYKLSIKYRPDYADVHNNLGLDYYRIGMNEMAKKELQEAINISPDYFQAYGNMGIILLEEKDFKGAAAYFKKVLEADPKNQLAKEYLESMEKELAE